tara:strand:- start:80 stop:538 length:459 start_codon:yes stop_codon:yes gene_type:complete
MSRLGFKFILTSLSAAVLCLGLSGAVMADEGAIKYRQSMMKIIGGHMGAMAAILKGQVDHRDQLAGHAHGLAEAAKFTLKVFPPGSGVGDTAALAAIWEKPAEFKDARDAMERESAKLAEVAKGGDMNAFGQQFGNLGKACKNCHQTFRKKR